jgi:RNA polymerase sigma-70 factor (ECF subfamily)
VQEQRSDEIDRYLDAMRDCLRHLPSTHRQLLQERYTSNGFVSALASQQGKSVAAISQLLYRIRQSLMDCIYRKVQEANA